MSGGNELTRLGTSLVVLLATSAAFASAGGELDSALRLAFEKAVSEAAHDASPDRDGAWVASNGANGFHTTFGPAGIWVEGCAEESPWRLGLELEAFGRAGELRSAGPATLVASGAWIEYRRADLVEWYQNDSSGLEQGFTLLAPPPSRAESPGNFVELRLRLTGDVQTELLEGRTSLLLRDACGELALSYSDLRAWDAGGERLDASLWLSDDALSILVDDTGAAYPITIDPLVASLEGKLLPGTVAPRTMLGVAVDVDGDTAVAAAPGYDPDCGCNAGLAFVFVRSGSTWALQARLFSESFSVVVSDVAVDGDRVALSINAYSGNQQSVEVYERTGTTWTSVGWFGHGNCCTSLGYSIDLDGDRLAYTDDLGGITNSKLYRRTPPSWSLEATLAPSAGLALRDDLAVLSTNPAPYYGPPCNIRVYQRTGTTWSFLADVKTFTAAGRYPVAIDEERTIAVGDPSDDEAGTNAGALFLLRRQGSAWVPWDKILSPDFPASTGFGGTLAFESGTLAVGVAGNDQVATDAGAVYLYRRNGGWNQELELFAPDGEADDRFGSDVGIDQDSLIVGAPRDDDEGTNLGSAYVFALSHEAEVYCTAKLNSLGCLPEIEFSGTPSASSASPFLIGARQVLNNRMGVFYYGLSGRAATPFQGGTRCVDYPIRRTGVQSSGGNPPPSDCSGVYSIDFNARIQSGIDPDLAAGVQVNGQFWTRDGGVPSGTGLSDAIEFLVQP